MVTGQLVFMIKVFIDGASGTTALQVIPRLSQLKQVELITLEPAVRKDTQARRHAINSSDVTFVCLKDALARKAVSLIENETVRVIDASSAHRVDARWTFGFPEYDATSVEKIRHARFVTNPGCFAMASIALLSPLVREGLVSPDYPVSIFAISGYTGGGKDMVAEFEDSDNSAYRQQTHFVYGLTTRHKHLPEIRHYSGLNSDPVFVPSVGDFPHGMIVAIPLHAALLNRTVNAQGIEDIYQAHYSPQRHVVVKKPEHRDPFRLCPDALVGTDMMQLQICTPGSDDRFILVAQLDNLGKGASGNAVENMKIMFDIA